MLKEYAVCKGNRPRLGIFENFLWREFPVTLKSTYYVAGYRWRYSRPIGAAGSGG